MAKTTKKWQPPAAFKKEVKALQKKADASMKKKNTIGSFIKNK